MLKKRVYELIYLILAVSVIFTALSLFSYNSSDPSYTNIVFSKYDGNTANLFGKAGAYTADYLGMLFGWNAMIIPFIFLSCLILMIRLYRGKTGVLRVFGAVLSMFGILLSLSLISGLTGSADPVFNSKFAGGIFGVSGGVVVASILGTAGGIIFSSVLLFLSILGTVNMSMTDFFNRIVIRISEIKENSTRKRVDKEEIYKDKAPGKIRLIVYSFLEKRRAMAIERKRLKEIEKEKNRIAQEIRAKEESEAVLNKKIESDHNVLTPAHKTQAINETTQIAGYSPDTTQQDTTQQGGLDEYRENIDTSEYLTVSELEQLMNAHENLKGTTIHEEELRLNSDNEPNTQDYEKPRNLYYQHSKEAVIHDNEYNGLRHKITDEPDIEPTIADAENEMDFNYEDKHSFEKNNKPDVTAYTVEKEEIAEYAAPTQFESSTVESIKNIPEIKENTIRKAEQSIHKTADDHGENYFLPLELLDPPMILQEGPDPVILEEKAELLVQALSDFGVSGRVKQIHPGPVVTMFELELAAGVKINKIANLEGDLALALSAMSIRILAPIPGKAAVGVEIPNPKRAMISIRELLETEKFRKNASPLVVALGKDIGGNPYFSDLSKMPHLLVAGTTGSGKSVCVNSLICSILYKASPEHVKFILIDPKMVELSVYDSIPHLAAPVVTDPRKAAAVLNNVVKEMESRYSLLAACRVKSIISYNNFMDNNPDFTDPDGEPLKYMPYMVVIVDEFADLMMVSGKEVETSICRIAQMARAVGIHLVLATQRPSVNVITGIIKANMPARISFKVSSKIDSRTIIDQNGAEILLGKGDSLFIPPGSSDPIRIHGCFVSEEEVLRVVDELKTYGEPEYDMALLEEKSNEENASGDFEESDARFDEALQVVKEKGFASISMIQRYLRIGYNRAARIVEDMERQGLISPSDGTSKPRDYIGG